jgi:hypothetical protein
MKEDNKKNWKQRIAKIIKECPELINMTGKLALYLTKGDLRKVKIEEKEI